MVYIPQLVCLDRLSTCVCRWLGNRSTPMRGTHIWPWWTSAHHELVVDSRHHQVINVNIQVKITIDVFESNHMIYQCQYISCIDSDCLNQPGPTNTRPEAPLPTPRESAAVVHAEMHGLGGLCRLSWVLSSRVQRNQDELGAWEVVVCDSVIVCSFLGAFSGSWFSLSSSNNSYMTWWKITTYF